MHDSGRSLVRKALDCKRSWGKEEWQEEDTQASQQKEKKRKGRDDEKNRGVPRGGGDTGSDHRDKRYGGKRALLEKGRKKNHGLGETA